MVKSQKTEVKRIKTITGDGVELWNISFTSLDCTYIETVRHISTEGLLPLEVFENRPAYDIYKAIVGHVKVTEGNEISLSDLDKYLGKMRDGYAFIVDADGYTDRWLKDCRNLINVDKYNLGSPYFSDDAMRGIIKAGTAILCGNFPSFSNPDTKDGFGIDMIAKFYETTGNMILAPLVNLNQVEETEVILQVNPMAVENCCGLPCSPIIYQGELKTGFLDYLTGKS
jgi:kynurenine formamidase